LVLGSSLVKWAFIEFETVKKGTHTQHPSSSHAVKVYKIFAMLMMEGDDAHGPGAEERERASHAEQSSPPLLLQQN
jgi:hypothetical protein